MKSFTQLERELIPKLRQKKGYKMTKFIIFMPFILPYHFISKGLNYLISKVKIKRKNKPDIILEHIVDGWKNYFLGDDQACESVALKRAKICSTCPAAQFSSTIYTAVADKKTKEIRGLLCEDCGCPLSSKVRARNSYCPRGLW